MYSFDSVKKDKVVELWDKKKWWIIGGFIILLVILFLLFRPEKNTISNEKPIFKYSTSNDIDVPLPEEKLNDAIEKYRAFVEHRDLTEGGSVCDSVPPINEYQNWTKKNDSNGEKATRQALQDIFGVPFPSIRPDWLKNKETGRNLELDGYNESFNMAFEYHGMQHYIRVPRFQPTEEDFQHRLYLDALKKKMCDDLGIYLIVVPFKVALEDIKDYVTYYLPENRKRRLDMDMTE